MASWKRVVYVLFTLLGGLAFVAETDGRRVETSGVSIGPPRLKNFFNLKKEIIKDLDDKKKNRLRTELIAAGNKFILQVPNPPIVVDHALEHWPYHRVYATSLLGIVTYIHKIFRIGYKVVWILIDMVVLTVKILFQLTEIGKLRHSYDELSRPHPFNYHDYDD